MKRAVIVLGFLVSMGGAAGCEPPATDAELKAMCENLWKLRAQADLPTEAELLAKVDEDFKAREKKLLDWRQRDLDGWDKELQAKLAAAADDAAKAALEEEYKKKKEVTAGQFEPDIAKLGPDKESAIAEAKRRVLDAAKDRQAEIDTCIADSKKEGIGQKMADCRTKAATADKYWNFCP